MNRNEGEGITLSPIETIPVVLMRFTKKADGDLIQFVEERLKLEGLLIVESETSYENTAVLGITTSQDRLELEAQAIRLVKRRADTNIMEAFDRQHREKYLDPSRPYRDELGLFSSNDRSLLVRRIVEDLKVLPEGELSTNLTRKLDTYKVSYRRQIMEEDEEVKPLLTEIKRAQQLSQSLVYVLEKDGYIDALSPVHQSALKLAIWNKTFRSHNVPLDMIRRYYGDEIGFYCAWMDTLTKWLIFPGVMGIVIYVFRYYRGDSVMNDEYTPFYGIITFFWAVLFLKFWKRTEVRLAYEWGNLVGEYEKTKYFALRPAFTGRLRISPVTGQVELYYPAYKRRIKLLVSIIVTIAMLSVAFWVMILSLNMQGYINPDYDPERWHENTRHPFHFPLLSRLAEPGQVFDMNSTWRSLIPVVLHVVSILTLNNIYRMVATRLTIWENHETSLRFSNSLVVKRFLFEAFDCYVALFYLAFYERDIQKLRLELVSVFNIDTIRRLATETLLPLIVRTLVERRSKQNAKLKKDDDAAASTYTPLSEQAELDDYEQFDDFMEIVIQFGYVTLFASAYPLASMISVISNFVEIRSDTFKLSFLCKRPRSLRIDGLNIWNSLLKGIVQLSALTNCFIFGFTSGQLMEWLPHFYHMEGDKMRFHDNKGWLVILIIFGMERTLIYMAMLLDAIIPDVPESVMDQLQRKYFVLEEESREFEHEQEQRQRKTWLKER